VPEIAAHHTSAQPFDALEAADWSLPALGLGAIATAFLEPDPEFTWDPARAAAIREALRRGHGQSGGEWPPPALSGQGQGTDRR
jgi:hypothetical protein